MNKLLEIKCNLSELDDFAKNLSKKAKTSDIYFLKGDLGVGKTTFTRFFINALFEKYNLKRPENIKSPSFPLLINYSLHRIEINHYDLFRIKDKDELIELDFFEKLEKNISIIEWPDIILNNYFIKKYYLIEIQIINIDKRLVKIYHSKKKIFKK